MNNITNYGVVLENGSEGKWDAGSAGFCCPFIDETTPSKIFLFYSGWGKKALNSKIGLAVSTDGFNFEKVADPILEGNKDDFCSYYSMTPVVKRIGDYYYMCFAGTSDPTSRSIGIAYSENVFGPWKIIKQLIKPEKFWEGHHIDLGSAVVELDSKTILLFYSNVSNRNSEKVYKILTNSTLLKNVFKRKSFRFNRRFLQRRLGILKLTIDSPDNISVEKYHGNPIKNLNGKFGEWNESLFCPGYIKIDNIHNLFFTASNYLTGEQFIGLSSSRSPYFNDDEILQYSKIIDGPSPRNNIIEGIKDQIALDTPSPIIFNDKLFLYYASMDRNDNIWKVNLSQFDLD